MLQHRLLAALLSAAAADFLLPAGNWTHSTNLFSTYHFVAGYNEQGEWDLITGGNWTPTNHSDVNLVGDAQIYVCPCPEPPCEPDEGPPPPGYNSSVFACLDPSSGNVSHAVCTVYHAERSNVTCVTPRHAIVCDLPQYDEAAPLVRWWLNDETPSRSYYSPNVTAVSCLVRDDMGERPLPDEYAGFGDALALQANLAVERCEIRCRGVCETVCVHEHRSVAHLLPQLDEWAFDAAVDDNPREFVDNGTLYQERRPAQYLRGVSARTAGREREPSNMTCTLPTMVARTHADLFGGLPGNLSATSGLFDLFGRRFNAMNVFDLTLYVALHGLTPLEGLQCVTPFPSGASLDPLAGEAAPHESVLVCPASPLHLTYISAVSRQVRPRLTRACSSATSQGSRRTT